MGTKKWDGMRAELKEREERYDSAIHRTFDLMTMRVYAEIKDLQRRMDELDGEFPEQDESG